MKTLLAIAIAIIFFSSPASASPIEEQWKALQAELRAAKKLQKLQQKIDKLCKEQPQLKSCKATESKTSGVSQ